jgi:hypothetical protein
MLEDQARDAAAAAGHGNRPSPLPAATAEAVVRLVDERLAAVAPRVLWDAIGDGIAAHLSPAAARVGLSYATRRRYIVEALESAAICPLCHAPGGHE